LAATAAGQGPTNDDQAQANIKRVMDSLDADVYAFSEVVDINRFKTLIESSAGYGFVVSDYCSNAANTSSGSYAPGQKIAFAYRKSVITNPVARGLLKSMHCRKFQLGEWTCSLLVAGRCCERNGYQKNEFYPSAWKVW